MISFYDIEGLIVNKDFIEGIYLLNFLRYTLCMYESSIYIYKNVLSNSEDIRPVSELEAREHMATKRF